MSYFIQDNIFCLKTIENHTLMFIKGGSNNCFDQNNKRSSSWHFQMGFKDEIQFEAYLDSLAEAFHGGEWQFQAILNKELDGYFAREAYGVERLRKAFRSATKVPLEMKVLDDTNIVSFIKQVLIPSCNMKVANCGLDIERSLLWLWEDDKKAGKTVDGEALRRLSLTPSEKYKNNGLANFYTKWADLAAEELVLNKGFCEEAAQNGYKISWDAGFGFLSQFKLDDPIVNNIPYENIKMLMLNDTSILMFTRAMGYNQERFLPLLESWEKIIAEDGFKIIFDRIVQDLDNGDKYNKDMACRIREDFSEFVAAVPRFEADKSHKLAEIFENAPIEFKKCWDRLEEFCWYKNTASVLPKLVDKMTGAFKLLGKSEISTINLDKVSCSQICDYYVKQGGIKSKNQEAIKHLAKLLCSSFYDVMIQSGTSPKEMTDFAEFFGFEGVSASDSTAVGVQSEFSELGGLFVFGAMA